MMKVLVILAVLCAIAYCDKQSCQFCTEVGADLFKKFNGDLTGITDSQLLSAMIDECKQRGTAMFETVCESMSKSLCPLIAQRVRNGATVDDICKEFQFC